MSLIYEFDVLVIEQNLIVIEQYKLTIFYITCIICVPHVTYLPSKMYPKI